MLFFVCLLKMIVYVIRIGVFVIYWIKDVESFGGYDRLKGYIIFIFF